MKSDYVQDNFHINFIEVIYMTAISSVAPTIAQTIQMLNSPKLPQFNVGTPVAEAASSVTVSDVSVSSGVGSSCGSSVDTYA